MKISIYEIDTYILDHPDFKEFNKIEEYLESRDFFKEERYQSQKMFGSFEVEVWIKCEPKFKMSWQTAIEQLMSNQSENPLIESTEYVSRFTDLGQKYDCIIMISKKIQNRKTYRFAVPFGQGYSTVEHICNPNFGITIASKIFSSNSFSITNVNKYFQSSLRQLTNYKRETYVNTGVSESYDAIIGTPIESFVKKLGKTVHCSKSFSTSHLSLKSFLTELLPFFDSYQSLRDNIDFPKANVIKKSDRKNLSLNKELLKKLRQDERNDLVLNVVGYLYANEQIRLIESEIDSIYVVNNIGERLKMKDKKANTETIMQFIKDNDEVENIIDFKIKVNEETQCKIYNLIDVLQVEVELDGVMYILNNGVWCTFNTTYSQKLDEYLSKIKINLRSNIGLENGNIKLEKGLNPSIEDKYFEYFKPHSEYYIGHKIFVKPIGADGPFGNGIEVYDIAKLGEEVEYIATKVGFSTLTSSYLIDQSLLSLIVLSNPGSFYFDSRFDLYKEPAIIAIQWILPKISGVTKDSRNIIRVENNSFKLSDLRSILLKNRIMEWHSKVIEYGKKPIIYIDTPEIS